MSRSPATPDVSVVIPAYNEAQRLPPTLERVAAYFTEKGRDAEILVVDDGSSDDTAGAARAFADRGVRVLVLDPNQGKGAALRRGVLESLGRLVLLCDADLSTPIEDIERLEPHLDETAVVLGSRSVPGADVAVRQPIYRELMGKVFNLAIRCAGVGGIHDTQCGFKLLDGEAARRIFAPMVTPGFAFDVEMVWLARQMGYVVREVGVTWRNSPSSRVRVLLDPPKMLLEIARFRWHHRGADFSSGTFSSDGSSSDVSSSDVSSSDAFS